MIAILRQQWPGREVPRHGRIVRVDYAGDEGGLMCRHEFGGEGNPAVHVSLTQLAFAPGTPLARAIAKYQKRRIKRLRRQGYTESD
jgi:hypothetical protein